MLDYERISAFQTASTSIILHHALICSSCSFFLLLIISHCAHPHPQVLLAEGQGVGKRQRFCGAGRICKEEASDWICGKFVFTLPDHALIQCLQQPFVEECINAHENFHAKKYVMRVTDLPQRCRFLVQLGYVQIYRVMEPFVYEAGFNDPNISMYKGLLQLNIKIQLNLFIPSISCDRLYQDAVDLAIQSKSDSMIQYITTHTQGRRDVAAMLSEARNAKPAK